MYIYYIYIYIYRERENFNQFTGNKHSKPGWPF